MKYLISGGNGFIGGFLSSFLKKRGNVVKTIGKSINNDYVVDLSISSFKISEKFDVIIHTASIVHNHKYTNNLEPNILLKDLSITINILKSIESLKFLKFIYLSSVSIYGVNFGKNLKINTPLLPKSGYGLSKYISEKMLINKIPIEKILILRLPLVNGSEPKGNILKSIKAIESGRMILFNGNNAKKSILELSDLAQFILNNSLNYSGINQIKSYDIYFNEFIQSLSNKKLITIPNFFLKFAIFLTNKLGMKNLYSTLIKLSSTLTFESSIKK